MISQRMFKYRIYPSRKQKVKLINTFKVCKEVYNSLLEQQQQYGFTKKFDFNQIITDIKITDNPYYSQVHSQVLQNVSDRASKAFDNFFSRVASKKQGKKVKAGFPRFKSRISSITFPQSGFKLKDKRVEVSKIGSIPIILSRPVQGTIKTFTIKKNKAEQWFAVFSCEIEHPDNNHPSTKRVGIDVGLERFATLSRNQGIVDNPRFFRKAEKNLAKLQRQLSRKVKGSNNRNNARIKVAKAHLKIFNQRTDFLHKTTSILAREYCFIGAEKLNINNMLKNHNLAKSISDAGWGNLIRMLSYKELTLGGQVVQINPAYSSQKCSGCGKRYKIKLSEREYKCPHCDLIKHRDNNSADNLENDTAGHAGIYTLVDTRPTPLHLAMASPMNEARTICEGR